MTNRPFKTGESREQASLLPARVEDYVGADNPVRAIESFVCALDLGKLGFRDADRGVEAMGRPPYDPADLLKLYINGYINQVRSSRRLEREACRNLELIWLLKNLKPSYRTIAKADELEAAIGQSLAQPGPALLNVKVENMTW
jgi:transposase